MKRMIIISVVVCLLILSGCKDDDERYEFKDSACIQKARSVIGDSVDVKVYKNADERKKKKLEICEFSFPESSLPITTEASCNMALGNSVGQNMNWFYGSVSAIATHEEKSVTDDNGFILGDNKFVFKMDFKQIDKIYPNDEIQANHVATSEEYDTFTFNINPDKGPVLNLISFQSCRFVN